MDGVPTGSGRSARFLRPATAVVAVLAFVAVFIALLLYITHFHRTWFNSDDAVLNMLADAMWQQGRLLPQHWINNNGDLLVPSGALLIAPLLRWFPNGFAVHAVAGVFAALLLTGSLAWLLRTWRMPTAVTLFLVTLAASGLSCANIFMVFTQTTYVWWPAGFFLGAALIVRQRACDRVMRRMEIAALCALVFIIGFANPSRVGLMMVLPLYLFDRALAKGDFRPERKSSWRARATRLVGFGDPASQGIAAAFVLALLVYAALARSGVTHASYNAADLHWAGVRGVWRHLATFRGWFGDYLGANPSPVEMSPSAFPGVHAFRWFIALGLTCVGIVEVARVRSQRDLQRRALTVALLGAFVPIFAIYALFDPLALDSGALRYFTVPMFILLVLSAFFLRDLMVVAERTTRVALCGGGVLLVLVSMQHYLPVADLGRATFWNVRASGPMQLAESLQTQHLQRGYATWLNAGATTVMSDSAVRVRPVVVSPAGVASFPYMVSTEWYIARPGETFLALTRQEASAAELELLRTKFGEPARIIDAAGYRILVYAYDIAARFDAWG